MPEESLPTTGPHFEEVLAGLLEAEERGEPLDLTLSLRSHPEHEAALREYFRDRDHFHRLAPGLAPRRARGRLAALPDLAAGSRFAGYEILSELGRGGMGIVYQARQLAPLREVALKVIRTDRLAELPAEGRQQWLQRFQREAQLIATLGQHPNLVTLYEVGADAGRPFFTMQLVQGGSLATISREPPTSAALQRAAAELVAKVARAIHHVHQHGVLHRDLKPGNILLDAAGQPLVGDFGLARRLDQSGSLVTGAIEGTAPYMPPEQARATPAAATTATDVYSLGAVLYELLTGRPPFKGVNDFETLLLVLASPPAAPRSLNASLPRDLETICLKCLEKEPGRRYGSAEALADDLERWIAGRPIEARAVGRLERAWLWCRRQPVLAATAAAALVLVALVGGLATLFHHEWNKRELQELLVAQARQEKEQQEKRVWETEEDLQQQQKKVRQAEEEKERQARLARQAQRDRAQAEIDQRVGDRLARAGQQAEERRRQQQWQDEQDLKDAARRRREQEQQRQRDTPLDGSVPTAASYLADMKTAARLAEAEDSRALVPLLDRYRPRRGGSDFRRWEWYYLQALAGTWQSSRGALLLERATGGKIELLAWSPDGTRVAVAAARGSLRVIELATGKQVSSATGVAWWTQLAWSPDSRRLAAQGHAPVGRGRASVVHVVDAAAGSTLLHSAADRAGPGPEARALDWSPDSARLAFRGAAAGIEIWQAATGKHKELPASGVTAFSWAPDGRLLAAAGKGKTLQLWEIDSARPPRALGELEGPAMDLSWSPDGGRLAVLTRTAQGLSEAGSGDVTLRARDGRSGQDLWVLRGCPEWGTVDRLAWSKDGTRLLLSTDLGRRPLKVVEAATGREVLTLPREVGTGDLFPFEGLLALASPSGLRIVSAESGQVVRHFENLGGGLVACSPDGNALAIGSSQGQLRVWSRALLMGQPAALRLRGAHAFSWAPAGRRFASAGRAFPSPLDGWGALFTASRITVGSLAGADLIEVGAADPGADVTTAAALSPDGKRLATLQRRSGNVLLWDVTAGANTHVLPRHPRDQVVGLAWSPGSRRLATLGDRGTVVVWDAAAGKKLTAFDLGSSPQGGGQVRLSWSADNCYLAGAGEHGVRVWEIPSGKVVHSFLARAEILALAPDAKRVATSAGIPPRIALREIAMGKEICSLKQEHDGGSAQLLSWSPAGEHLLHGTAVTHLWNSATRAAVKLPFHASSAAWSPDGKQLALLCGQEVRTFDAASGAAVAKYPLPGNSSPFGDGPHQLAWTPDGLRVLVRGPAPRAQVVSLPEGRDLFSEPRAAQPPGDPGVFPIRTAETNDVLVAAWSPDGRQLATINPPPRNDCSLWDAATGAEIRTLPLRSLQPGRVGLMTVMGVCLAWSPDGKQLAFAADGEAQVWDLAAEGKNDWGFAVGATPLGCAWSPDSRRLAVLAHKDPTRQHVVLTVWEPATRKRLLTKDLAGTSQRGAVAWSPDGRHLAVGSDRVVVCDAQTGKERVALARSATPVCRLEWSPDGGRLLCRAWDSGPKPGTSGAAVLTVWDAASGSHILSLRGPAAAASWSPDRVWLAAAPTSDGEIVIREAPEP